MQALAEQLNLPKDSTGPQIVQELEKQRLAQLNKTGTKIAPLTGKDLVVLSQTKEEDKLAWEATGFEMIAKSTVSLVVLAGGLGTRLGFLHPKGCYDVGLPSHSTLFALLSMKVQRLELNAQKRFPGTKPLIHVYFMTGFTNNKETRQYFQDNKFFGLKPEQVHFFCQSNIPVISYEGEIFKLPSSSPYISATPEGTIAAPNGNGGVYESLLKSGCFEEMKKTKVEWVHFIGIDNILVKPCDPVFLGLCATNKVQLGNKAVTKSHPGEKVGIFCWRTTGEARDREYCVTEYMEMTEEETKMVDPATGNLAYSAGNILSHLFSFPFLAECVENSSTLPYHVTKKDSGYMCDTIEVPPKTYKLEKFIFDAFARAKNVVTLELERAEEFSPVKNKAGADSPETARAMLSAMWDRWIKEAGGIIDAKAREEKPFIVEILPTLSIDGTGLEETVKGKTFSSETILS